VPLHRIWSAGTTRLTLAATEKVLLTAVPRRGIAIGKLAGALSLWPPGW
jgi:hypothetical protein